MAECVHQQAFFAEFAGRGQRLCIWTAPISRPIRSIVVHVHAFGEEMNKSRRMVAQCARLLAELGHAVLQFDLRGCGDSESEFVDASWQDWEDDLDQALELARSLQMNQARDWPGATPPEAWIWTHRAGALVAGKSICSTARDCNLLLWQPVVEGRLVLQHWLRLRVAADKLAGSTGTTTKHLRERLSKGETLEIAGYGLTPVMAGALDAAKLPLAVGNRRVEWVEVGATADAQLSPAGSRIVEAWRRAGTQVSAHVVTGPAFWQTAEIEDAPAMIDATLSALVDVGARA